MTEVEYMRLMNGVATFIENRKMSGSVLVPDAEAGFNLACDFLSSELRKLTEMQTRDLSAAVRASATKEGTSK